MTPDLVLCDAFVAVPMGFVQARGLSTGARVLFTRLMAYRNRRTGQCNPRRQTLAAALGVCLRTITRWLRELRTAGWITARHRIRGQSYQLWEQADADKNVQSRLDTFGHSIEPEELNQKTTTAAAEKGRSSPAAEGQRAAAACGFVGAPNKTPDRPLNPEAAALVEELMPQHPEPGNPLRAVAELGAVLDNAKDVNDATDQIRRNHAGWRAHWETLDRGRFIPQLWRWVASGEWKYQPVERKGVKRESFTDRCRRELRESDEREYRELADEGRWDELEARMEDDDFKALRARYEKSA